jgi:D-alanyl-D-alanine carboxypeptidase
MTRDWELTRMVASRALRFIACVLGTISVGGATAATPALVVDVDSGKVLYAERATDPWFPASITKLMTVYVALNAVREGKLSIDSLLTVSENAASMPPSKMAFRPGTQIRLDNALKIIMVKSANDVSATIAEGIGGTVEGFAQMMNDSGRRLGMRESHWTNPHGLPDPAQFTSARDMAILGRALTREFPEYRELFQLSAIKLGRRVMANHNGLIGRYPGADGMKTGFICSSGFNVVASATREGRRLITVVMGSRSAAERTIKAADLFDRGFAASSFWSTRMLEDLPPSNVAAAPDMRPLICGGRGPMPSEEDSGVAQANASGNAENANANGLFAAPGFSALAFAGVSSVAAGPRKLGPRAPLQPVLVWTGREPNTNLADNEESPAKKAGKRGTNAKAIAKRQPTPASVAAAKAATAAKARAAISQGSAPSVGETAKPKLAATPLVAAKPAKAVAAKAATPKPAAVKSSAVTKPAAATKPATAKKTAEAKRPAKPRSAE